eukprot:2735641-Pyramimonas_sp.AAC.1
MPTQKSLSLRRRRGALWRGREACGRHPVARSCNQGGRGVPSDGRLVYLNRNTCCRHKSTTDQREPGYEKAWVTEARVFRKPVDLVSDENVPLSCRICTNARRARFARIPPAAHPVLQPSWRVLIRAGGDDGTATGSVGLPPGSIQGPPSA